MSSQPTDSGSDAPTRLHHKNPRGQGSRLRTELLSAAIDILEAGGTENDLSIRAVTRRVGVTPQAFYLQFADRDELLWAVYAREFEELEDALQDSAAAAASPPARLRARVHAYGRYAEQHPAKYRVLFGILSTYTSPAAGDTLPSDRSFAAWSAAVGACQEGGHCRQDDRQLLTITLLGAIHGLVLLRLNKPGRPWPSLDRLFEDVLVHQLGLPAPAEEAS